MFDFVLQAHQNSDGGDVHTTIPSFVVLNSGYDKGTGHRR
jgi:hypothetical protein